MKRTLMILLAMVLSPLAAMAAQGQDLKTKPNPAHVSAFLEANGTSLPSKEWNVATVELGPGAIDSRAVRPGVGLVYVLEGGGILELDGKASMALRPGVAASLNPEKSHVLKNTSETETLRILIVHHREQDRHGVAGEQAGAKAQRKQPSPERTKF